VAAPTLEERLRGCSRSAVHLEMRDGYMRSDSRFGAWQNGLRDNPADRDPEQRPWLRLVADVPGFFQTPAYATVLMSRITDFQGSPNDVAHAVAARVARSRFLYEGNRRFVVVMEECVLRYRIGDATTMAGQLQHLLSVLPLPSVSLGVIPFTAERILWPLEAFYLHDGARNVVEPLTAEINIVQPRELADYGRAFTELSKMAVYGDGARALINSAISDLN